MNKKVLIIDDDARNIFALKAILRSRHFNCISTTHVEEAITLLKKEGSDTGVILMDMMMPDIDGYTAIPIIKDITPDIPVVAVTAQAMNGDEEKCLKAGADHYISKPVDVDKLLSLLYTYLT